jgi:hypothetical protein
MFRANFKEKDSFEIELPDKSYDDIYELLQIIYPPNKPISAINCPKVLQLADEYQIVELNRRCRHFLLNQRGTVDILLLAQRYGFDEVIKRCSDHLKHSLTSKILSEDPKIKEINVETMNTVLAARCKHLGIWFWHMALNQKRKINFFNFFHLKRILWIHLKRKWLVLVRNFVISKNYQVLLLFN